MLPTALRTQKRKLSSGSHNQILTDTECCDGNEPITAFLIDTATRRHHFVLSRNSPPMKAFYNDPHHAISEGIEGYCAAFPHTLTLHREPMWISRAGSPSPDRPRVAVICGGGSGHEPLHLGYIGEGMLDAAVPGPLFTSPTPDAILAAIEGVDQGPGVLVIVKNYTGDVLNFQMATELARMSGHKVETVIVADDVAVEDSDFTAGRRGVAGVLFVEKIAGALAARGESLATMARICRDVSARIASMGVALAGCHHPGEKEASFDIAEENMEFGIGIHGEKGRACMPQPRADEVAELLLQAVLSAQNVNPDEELIIILNNLGTTPLYQLSILYRQIAKRLDELAIRVDDVLMGTYVTSLDMLGVSLSVLPASAMYRELWHAPVATPALRWGC